MKELKENYEKLILKYKLPSFKELNESFEIDKIEYPSDCLLRQIRKVMIEKIVNATNFVEMLLNPVNAPRIYYSYLKSVSIEDKKIIEEIYSVFGELSLDSLELEVDYSEAKEAELIKKILIDWNRVKPKFKKIVEHIKKPSNSESKKERSYFG